jgi:hypothetical protein
MINSMLDPRSFSLYAFVPFGDDPSESKPMKKDGWKTLPQPLPLPLLPNEVSGTWV